MVLSGLMRLCKNSVTRRFSDSVNKLDSLKRPEALFSALSSEIDVSDVTPHFPQSFNLAAYVNSSETLRMFMDMNVDLSKIEKKPYIAKKLLALDFEKNVKEHVVFLQEYVDLEHMSRFITKNPMIFYESLEDLQVRVNYLMSKQFSNKQISHIITKNPFWLMLR